MVNKSDATDADVERILVGEIVPENEPTDVEWWEETDGDEVEGYDLVKNEALFSLVGVPFRITKLTYHDGIQQPGCDWRNDFVSAELRVFPDSYLLANMDRILSRRTGDLIASKTNIAKGEELLVINDGSTGFYRQSTQYLEAKGSIALPPGQGTGGKNECVYDFPRSMWLGGEEEASAGISVKLNCLRGLRYSDYESEFGPKGERAITWYIA